MWNAFCGLVVAAIAVDLVADGICKVIEASKKGEYKINDLCSRVDNLEKRVEGLEEQPKPA